MDRELILNELKACGFKAQINRYSLKVSGRRTTWKEAYWIAFLGWKHGIGEPKLIRIV